MNTYITRWLFMCTVVVSTVFSYTLEELKDPTFQPFENREINQWERARMIEELEAEMKLPNEINEKEDANNYIPLTPINNDEHVRIKLENAEEAERAHQLQLEYEASSQEHIPNPQIEEEDNSIDVEVNEAIETQNNYDHLIDVNEKEAFNQSFQQKLETEARAEKDKRMKEFRDQRESLKRVLTREEQAAEFYSNNSIIEIGINNALENAGSSRCDDNALTLTLSDSWGDTWNGATLGINGVVYTIDSSSLSGSSAVFDLCLPDGDYTYTYTAGSYAYENSYSLATSGGITLFSGSGYNMSSGDTTTGDFSVSSNAVAGCTDADACNFDATATINDGTCISQNACGSCPDVDGNYDTSCLGCTDETALNYDSSATVDDGSCYNNGDVCAAAIPLTLPLTLDGTTTGQGNFYSSTPCSSTTTNAAHRV